ncbi:hypothetical protein BK816_08745 [Boudabousia tangfeifanii]|uniref:Uncharacterized protein n=1 Tax=Boudabousia tangfeifanii TaxID=1912795 RepID=A0A1D9MM25_9ACTO|nr:hypothetical protein [Boudabousia tangfeifanii]AOZ73346.1 hypothetical protein BK816_08745 [Boudabousia tangfeifanii]
MTESREARRLPGHTNVSTRAVHATIKGAAAQHLGVPMAAINVSCNRDETPLTVSLKTAVPNTWLEDPGTNVIAALQTARSNLRDHLTELLGAKVGVVELNIMSIYYPNPEDAPANNSGSSFRNAWGLFSSDSSNTSAQSEPERRRVE